MINELYIAVDLGAGSGRVFLCDLDKDFSLEEIHRFANVPVRECFMLAATAVPLPTVVGTSFKSLGS